MQERIKYWRSPQFANLELLHAHYVTHAFNRHIHETFAIGVILEGAEGFSYRGESLVAPAGHLVMINPGEPHTGHSATESGWTYRMLYPDVSLLQRSLHDGHPGNSTIPFFPTPIVRDPEMQHALLRLHLALEQQPSQLEQDSRMLWTMTQLVNRYGDSRPQLHPTGYDAAPIRLVQRYLDDHFTQNPTLDELAAIANLSPFYLLRSFRKQVGLPPHEYLTQARLRDAKRRLLDGQSIADVAHATGFADQSHLTRQFKRMTGVPPGQFQRQSKIVQDPLRGNSLQCER